MCEIGGAVSRLNEQRSLLRLGTLAQVATLLVASQAAAQCPKYQVEVFAGEQCGGSLWTWVYPQALNETGEVAGFVNECQLGPNEAGLRV